MYSTVQNNAPNPENRPKVRQNVIPFYRYYKEYRVVFKKCFYFELDTI